MNAAAVGSIQAADARTLLTNRRVQRVCAMYLKVAVGKRLSHRWIPPSRHRGIAPAACADGGPARYRDRMHPDRAIAPMALRLQQAAAAQFVGRDRERALLAGLLVRGSGPAVVFVSGQGGIGKSALVTATVAGLDLPVGAPG